MNTPTATRLVREAEQTETHGWTVGSSTFWTDSAIIQRNIV